MTDAFGVVVFAHDDVYVDGLQDHRSTGAITFLGRYRLIDFPLSNMANSGIENINMFVKDHPRGVISHVGTGRQYNINSKRGGVDTMFEGPTGAGSGLYRHDVNSFMFNRHDIERMPQKYVVVATNYMVYSIDYNDVIAQHIETGADITMIYKTVDTAKEEFINCDVLDLNKQNGVSSIVKNRGNEDTKNISLESYVMSKEMFLALVDEASATSSLYWMSDMINDSCKNLDIRGYKYEGYLKAITNFQSYYAANMELLDACERKELFKEDWQIYTATEDSAPTRYGASGSSKGSLICNGCLVDGTVINSIIGRGCVIEEGAVVEDSIILPGSVISKDSKISCAVLDKRVEVSVVKEVVGTKDQPVYVKKDDKI